MVERLKVIKGPMFSGKTAELIRQISNEEEAELKLQVFKSSVDVRWDSLNSIRSHAGAEYPAISVDTPDQILEHLENDVEVVFIDEVQFFDEYIVPVIEELLERNIKVIVAGLPIDFRNEPFGQMPILLAKADEIVSITARCKFKQNENERVCGEEATKTQRILYGKPAKYTDPVVMVGAEEVYEARCPAHHDVPEKPERKFKKRNDQEEQ